MLRRHRPSVLFGVAIIFVLVSMVIGTQSLPAVAELSEVKKVIIDAGHGGVDPGAIGIGGIEEKTINLAISLYLKDILTVNGYEVIMVRENDISVNDSKYTNISSLKTSDLKNRLRLIESYPDAIAVSIHQNKYPLSSAQGAQMFYGRKNQQSKVLAQAIQTEFAEQLQLSNKRQIKPSTSSVFVLHQATIPITLVECGFISNQNDVSLLVDAEYQQKVAFAIFCGIVNAKQL